MTTNTRTTLLVGLGCGLVLGLTLAVYFGLGRGRAKPEANAAGEKEKLRPSFVLYEDGPERKMPYGPFPNAKVRARREIGEDGKAHYFAYMTSGPGLMIPEDSVADLVRKYTRFKDRKKPESEAVEDSKVRWITPLHPTGSYTAVYSLASKKWAWVGGFANEHDIIPPLEQVLKDIKEMKDVKPALNW